jgi:hypothetical protein
LGKRKHTFFNIKSEFLVILKFCNTYLVAEVS